MMKTMVLVKKILLGETMKKVIKSFLKVIVNWMVSLARNFRIGRYVYEQILDGSMSQTKAIDHFGVKLKFAVPNSLSNYRADSFSTKEPETLEWIDAMQEGSVVWDIGANVGIYSCYAAKRRNCRVFSFEPSVFNLELLARNIFLNGLTKRVTIVPLPLSDVLSFNNLNMTSTAWGGAMSTFGQSYGHDGEIMQKVFEFPTIGLSMVDAVERLKIPPPDYIKMDVDGIEHLVLKGGMPVLSKTKGILIEINDKFNTQANEADLYLREAGFTFKEKRHAEYFDVATTAEKYTYNQIWVK
jgi:FkbM family methyltransferase